MKSYNGFTPQQREASIPILKKAIAEGRIKDPMHDKCCICGQDKGIRHLHNEDYSPDKVVEDAHCVCWRCHMMIHGRFRHPNSFAKYMIDVTIYKKQFPPVYRPTDWGALNINLID